MSIASRKEKLETGRKNSGQLKGLVTPEVKIIDNGRKSDRVLLVRLPTKDLSFGNISEFVAGDKLLYPQACDVVGINPPNSDNDIELCREYIKNSTANDIFMSGSYEKDTGAIYSREEALRHVKLYGVKVELLELLASKLEKPKTFTEKLARNNSESYSRLLFLLSLDKETQEMVLSHTHINDVLEKFKGIITLQELANTQNAAYRKVYTIAGVEHKNGQPEYIDLCVATGVTFTVPMGSFGAGKIYEGRGSGFFKSQLKHPKPTPMFVQPRSMGSPEKDRNFIAGLNSTASAEMIEKLQKPITFIIAGSGMAAAKSILQERDYWKSQGAEIGDATLLYGIRNANTDLIFEEEVIRKCTTVILAESRNPNKDKQYVQNILENGTLDKQLIEMAKGKRHLVICGDEKMGDGVWECLEQKIPKLLSSHKNLAHHTIDTIENQLDAIMYSASGSRSSGIVSLDIISNFKSSNISRSA